MNIKTKVILTIASIVGVSAAVALPVSAVYAQKSKNNLNANSYNSIEIAKQNIAKNFNNIINSNNVNDLLNDYESSINTIINLSNNVLKREDIIDFSIQDLSQNIDQNLQLQININCVGGGINLEINSNIINPNNDINLSYFIINENGELEGLTESGLNQSELIIPSNVKIVTWPSRYGENVIKNVRKINFGFARNFTGFKNNESFCRNESIQEISFNGCSKLTTLGNGIFSRCSKLEKVSFNGCSNLTNIPQYAFSFPDKSSSSLLEVDFTNCKKLETIEDYAFKNCAKLTKLDFSTTSEFWNSIKTEAFVNCDHLTTLNLSKISKIQTVATNIFNGCIALSKVEISSAFIQKKLITPYQNANLSNAYEDVVSSKNRFNSSYQNINDTTNTIKYDEDAFLMNAENVAYDDSVLWYSVNWGATLHKYGCITHLLKVLELNPNKEIHLIATKTWYPENKFDLQLLVNTYPNIHLKWVDRNISQTASQSFKLAGYDLFMNDVDSTKINILYTADFNFLYNFNGDIDVNSINNEMKNNLTDSYFRAMNLFKEINVIGDGTASVHFYNDRAYHAMSNSYFYFDPQTQTFPKLIELHKMCSKMTSQEFRDWLDQDKVNAYIYMLSTACASKSTIINGSSRVNVYMPYTGLVKDVNNITSSELKDNQYFNEYFDPYNTMGMNFIKLVNSYNKSTLDLFCDIIKCPQLDIENYENEFSNAYNIIYGGKKMAGNNETITSEAQRLIKVAKLHANSTNGLNLKIWFKGHPTDFDSYWNTLKNKIKELIKNDESIDNKELFMQQFQCLKKEIPIEIYLASGVFNNNADKQIHVKIYTSYSTYVLSMIANNMIDSIENIIVNQDNINEITKFFGTESLCFPSSLLITEEQLFS